MSPKSERKQKENMDCTENITLIEEEEQASDNFLCCIIGGGRQVS